MKMYNTLSKAVIISILIVATSCEAQIGSSISNAENKHKTMNNFKCFTENELTQKFDYKTYNENFDKDGLIQYYEYFLGDSTKINLAVNVYGPTEIRSKENCPIKQRIYYNEEGQLKKVSNTFNNSLIGISREYDRNGAVMKEIDHDKDFELSFEDMREIVLEEYSVDIFDTRQAVALRHEQDLNAEFSDAYYQIHVLKTLPNGIVKPDYSMLLDPETGERIK